jgi:hypothetical protein
MRADAAGAYRGLILLALALGVRRDFDAIGCTCGERMGDVLSARIDIG